MHRKARSQLHRVPSVQEGHAPLPVKTDRAGLAIGKIARRQNVLLRAHSENARNVMLMRRPWHQGSRAIECFHARFVSAGSTITLPEGVGTS